MRPLLTLAALGALVPVALAGQDRQPPVKPTASPQFEAATFKPSQSPSPGGTLAPRPGGLLRGTNIPLYSLVSFGYQLQNYQVTGDPDWFRRERYDLTATAEGNPSIDDMRAMTRALLAERLQFVAHRETRMVAGYELVALRPGRLGPNLRPSLRDCFKPAAERPPVVLQPNQLPPNPCGITHEGTSVKAGDMSLENLVQTLSSATRTRVDDRTGLTGNYDVDLKWSDLEVTDTPPVAPPIFTAVEEQLGLRLQRAQIPTEVLVIDSVSRPKEN